MAIIKNPITIVGGGNGLEIVEGSYVVTSPVYSFSFTNPKRGIIPVLMEVMYDGTPTIKDKAFLFYETWAFRPHTYTYNCSCVSYLLGTSGQLVTYGSSANNTAYATDDTILFNVLNQGGRFYEGTYKYRLVYPTEERTATRIVTIPANTYTSMSECCTSLRFLFGFDTKRITKATLLDEPTTTYQLVSYDSSINSRYCNRQGGSTALWGSDTTTTYSGKLIEGTQYEITATLL